jgi:hypothetical protein
VCHSADAATPWHLVEPQRRTPSCLQQLSAFQGPASSSSPQQQARAVLETSTTVRAEQPNSECRCKDLRHARCVLLAWCLQDPFALCIGAQRWRREHPPTFRMQPHLGTIEHVSYINRLMLNRSPRDGTIIPPPSAVITHIRQSVLPHPVFQVDEPHVSQVQSLHLASIRYFNEIELDPTGEVNSSSQ